MIELTIAAVVFLGGWWTGHEHPTVSCLNAPLITANCVEIKPPQDDSFGATTTSYIELVGTYRKCKAACEAAK